MDWYNWFFELLIQVVAGLLMVFISFRYELPQKLDRKMNSVKFMVDIKYHGFFHTLKSYWERFKIFLFWNHVSKDEFHKSLDINSDAIKTMTKAQENKYVKRLSLKRTLSGKKIRGEDLSYFNENYPELKYES